MTSVADYENNLTGDDWSSVFAAALNGTPAGGTLYVPPGTYTLSTWTAHDQTVPVSIIGAGRASVHIIGPDRKTTFIEARANTHIEGVTFSNWGAPVAAAFEGFPLDELSLQAVAVHDCNLAVSADSAETARVERFTVTGSTFRGLSDAAFVVRFAGAVVNIAGNDFADVARYIFRNITNKSRENQPVVRFENNRVDSIHAGAYTEWVGVARVLQVRCVSLFVRGNHFSEIRTMGPLNPDNVTATGNANVAYMDVDEAIITGNSHTNCGSPSTATSGLYHFKAAARRGIITGNTFDNAGVTASIHAIILEGGGFIVSDNVFTNYLGSAVYCSWIGVQTARIAGNVFRNHRGAPLSISGAFRDVVVENNMFDGLSEHQRSWGGNVRMVAIWVVKSSAPKVGSNLTIRNNLFRDIVPQIDGVPTGDGAAVYVAAYDTEDNYEGLHIVGNRFQSVTTMLYVRATGGAITDLQMCDNDLINVKVPVWVDPGLDRLEVTRFRDNLGMVDIPADRP